MLKPDVVEAVKDGRFSIYPIQRVEEGLEIITGMKAGDRSEDGTYPEGTINYRVAARLAEISEAMKAKKEGEKEDNKPDK